MKLFRIGLVIAVLNTVALACWMIPGPPTKLQGTAVDGRFTYEGKPLRGSKVQLRKQGRLVATAVTDRNGNYSFQALPRGIYEIRMVNPSYEAFQVDLSLNFTKQQRFLVNFYADYCYNIDVPTN